MNELPRAYADVSYSPIMRARALLGGLLTSLIEISKPFVKKSSLIALFIAITLCILGIYIASPLVKDMPYLISGIRDLIHRYGLIGLFLATIVAGTLVPIASPALVACAAAFGMPKLLLTAAASTGYTVGVAIGYALGYYLGSPYVVRKIGMEMFESLVGWWDRYGYVLCVIFGLTPGLPLDLLALVCGLLRMKLHHFVCICFVTSSIQYGIFAYLGEVVGGWIGMYFM